MEILPSKTDTSISAVPEKIPREITRDEENIFRQITSRQLTGKERERIKTPPRIYPRQEAVLAAHWHPEFI
ncbi:MAG: hypothetical protein ACQETR_16415, partial [Thermodesulfobacteriota bacterium]